MRARALALVALLVLPATLTGCLGGEDEAPGERTLFGDAVIRSPPPEWLVEEDRAAEDDAPAPPRQQPETIRVEVNGSWQVGDQWYYESNKSNWMRVYVERLFYRNGHPYYGVYTETGLIGYWDDGKWTRSIVDAVTYETTTTFGPNGRSNYEPAHPGLRFLHNGTYRYREEGGARTEVGDAGWNYSYDVRVRPQFTRTARVLGDTECEVTHFKVYTSRWEPNNPKGGVAQLLMERFYCPALQNDIFIIGNTREAYRLTGYRVGDREDGIHVRDPDPDKPWPRID